ncbi:FAD/NAD(P)-binding domain-containing protein [Mycena chlorophos]|uniref:FAD/NAD(P)-binding domain-containing protein n=1 Tax=Mycena chlorophos TaxID=658473 RepID=A0A8H6RYH1_MYCCL|nr:FAD/NAD(P)-binding domain-containing protein [Mycena chlorophos]
MPLKVVIVGAGIGGLSAAVSMRHAGHDVKVFEASESKKEIGAGVGLQPNALRALNFLGVKREKLQGVEWRGVATFDAETAERHDPPPIPNFEQLQREGINHLTCLREDLHQELRRLATEAGGDASFGPPVELHLGSKVTTCDPEAGTVTLSNGEVVSGDVVIGADGVNSVVRTSVVGKPVPAEATGFGCYRCLFDPGDRSADFDWAFQQFTSARMKSPFGEFISYGVRSGTLGNFVGFYTESEPKRDSSEPIAQVATKEMALAALSKFDPMFHRIFELPLASQVVKWQLRTVPRLPTWINGRAAIMGDAAHAMLPLLGSGAAMAIEEGTCLGILFPAGTKSEDVPKRLEAFQDLRKERGDYVKEQSTAQAKWENREHIARHIKVINAYDVVGATQEYLRSHF